MQYKSNKKIIIDKRKLDTVIRLGCPSDVLLRLITTGEYKPTGDSLIDENLESMRDEKEFTNWGGNRNPTGKNQYTSKNNKLGQVDHHLDHQDEAQDIGQLEDIDKDIDIELDKDRYNNLFEEFWNLYTPIKCDGRFVAKGSKKTAYEKFVKILKKGESYENIIAGTKRYIEHCRANNQLTCQATVFLNQERWNNEYDTAILGENTRGKQQAGNSILQDYARVAYELGYTNDIH